MTKQDLIDDVTRLYDECIAECQRQITENEVIIARTDAFLRRHTDEVDMACLRRSLTR